MRLFFSERKVYTIRGRLLILLFVIFVFSMLMLFLYNTCYSGTIKEKARNRANTVAVTAINTAINRTIAEHNMNYEDFFDITVKNDLSVSYMTLNTVSVNKFKTCVTQKIIDVLSEYEREEIIMTPFSVYGYTNVPFGLKIPVLVIPVEILSTDFSNDFQSKGVVNEDKQSAAPHSGCNGGRNFHGLWYFLVGALQFRYRLLYCNEFGRIIKNWLEFWHLDSRA